MISKNKECPVCGTFVSQVFLTCARAVHTHAHTHTHTHTHTDGWKCTGHFGFLFLLDCFARVLRSEHYPAEDDNWRMYKVWEV